MENFCTLFCLESDVALYNAFGVFHLLSWQAFIYSVVDLFSLLNLSMRACSSLFYDSKFNFLPWPWEGESAGKAQGWHVPASWWVGVAPSKEARRAEGQQIHHAGWHIRWSYSLLLEETSTDLWIFGKINQSLSLLICSNASLRITSNSPNEIQVAAGNSVLWLQELPKRPNANCNIKSHHPF